MLGHPNLYSKSKHKAVPLLHQPPFVTASPASFSTPSDPSAHRPLVCTVPQTSPPLLPSLPSEPVAAAVDKNRASQTLASTSTLINLAIVTPESPHFSINTLSIDEANETSCSLDDLNNDCKTSLELKREIVDMSETMQLPTPTLTNSPSSPNELEITLEELERYLPLSNLPTPPLSDPSSPDTLLELDFEDLLNPELLGPATHLVSMIPKNASREAPSVHIIQAMLQRSGVRMEVIALASCVLDCVSSRFLRRWRLECCTEEGSLEHCEVLAVASLSIAQKFLEDTSFSGRMWARDISEARFSTRSLNKTEWLILEDINFSVAGICTPELIEISIHEMKRCSASLMPRNTLPCLTQGVASSKKLSKTAFPRLSDIGTVGVNHSEEPCFSTVSHMESVSEAHQPLEVFD
ncbi:hypothetical protein RUND412_003630 [Rhizina undulata]